MRSQLLEAQDIFLGGINQICGKFGLNNIMAQLYALLYRSNGPLSLDDMVERLKISKASVSVNIRELENYGAARRVWIKGSRKDYYQAETDIVKVIMDRIKSMAKGRLVEIDNMLDAAYRMLSSIEASGKDEQDRIEIFRQRLETLRSFQKKAKILDNLFNSEFLSNLLNTKVKADKHTEEVFVAAE